jgi:amino acid transporter
MANDHFLPAFLAAREGRPPVWSVLMQSLLAVSLVFLSGFRELLNNVGSVLAIVSAATVLSLLRRSRWRTGERPPLLAMLGAVVYACMSGWMVYFVVKTSSRVNLLGIGFPSVVLWMVGIVVIASIAYLITRSLRPDAGAAGRRRRTDRGREDWAQRRSSLLPPPA